ncbi:prephenate dehydratase [Fuchsiella alkaliacetigena]|uniref:prephenate dehydratase n=1 Tax=Fuchsiella alkaliacetigena TaxID=957042 RepID=UPI00200AA682|nr:prephenate dehydratase [Fuchsiella alkaliacetigena]MCK8824491.1 prephenate dehydratase [Fuchsiella alkaliacetigena]
MNRLAYLGPAGTFTEQAAREYIAEEQVELIPYADISSLIWAVAKREEEYGIVPIENSLEGSVNITLDLLAHKVDLKIKAEVVMPIEHNLIGHAETELSKIEKVLSHPQALAQCRDNLNSLLSDFESVSVNSTAEAVQRIQDKDSSWAAIGSTLVSKLNGLSILEERIQDNLANWTRFIVLAQQDGSEQGLKTKTSLICSPVKNRPGILYEILKEFAQRSIDLTKIESRPTREMLGDYLFFIDFEGNRTEKRVEQTLAALEDKTSFIKLLGSYPSLVVE